MKLTRLVTMFIAVICITGTLVVSAEDESESFLPEPLGLLDYEAGVDLNSKYIWRGQTLVDGFVVQPTATIGYKWFSLNWWANYDADRTDDLSPTREWTESDFTADITFDLGFINEELEKISLSGGYIYYDFPNADSDSQEFYGGISVDVILAPYFTVYHDFDDGDGTYLEWGLGHSFELEPVSINLGASMGYNDKQWGYEGSFTSTLLSLSVTVPVGEYFAIEPHISESIAMDSQYTDEFFAGCSFTLNF
ncbi:MAG: hypothetical protein U9Q21_00595 [Candidatus Auribacterota bacterium]|nr:hypothetical protein [Candidatus Auribacterota bacterium]